MKNIRYFALPSTCVNEAYRPFNGPPNYLIAKYIYCVGSAFAVNPETLDRIDKHNVSHVTLSGALEYVARGAWVEVFPETPKPDRIATLEVKLSEAQAELAALKADRAAKAVVSKPPKKWEPRGGRFLLWSNGGIGETLSGRPSGMDRVDQKNCGSRYPTREAAESAMPYVVFFKRLCCLAAELNPSGKVGGNYSVGKICCGDFVFSATRALDRGVLALFETEDAAKKAAEILNRDNWTVPTL